MRVSAAIVIGALLAVGAGCSSNAETTSSSARSSPSTREVSRPASNLREGYPKVVFLGDSLTAGYGLAQEQAYVSLLQRRIDTLGLNYEMVNAGVSGDTSAGGLRRLDWALEGDVRVLLVALGGNDGLRGLPVDELRVNLTRIIERGQRKGATVILAGMEAPPNYGPDYTRAFHQVYPDLARQYKIALIPFLLSGVAGLPELNQRDGIHPNEQGARIVEQTVWTALGPVLQRRHE